MHNIDNNGKYVINANFVLLYICSFLFDFHQMGFANVKFNINGFRVMYSEVDIFIDLVHF